MDRSNRASDGQLDYSDLMRLARQLCGYDEALECLRGAILNLLAVNRDDRGRNRARPDPLTILGLR